MSAVRHPNIVQYLGMFRDTDTCLPVLLMELMDDSLTNVLESSTQPIPYHIQVNICHDVTLALSFLHSNNIVHRDLSGNNVLLRGNVLAKVTDFGMARLGDINPQATHFTNTMCPGTDVYMPPEAVQDKPVYTEKIDCFSFGVIIVQILTRQFPKPGDRLQEIEFNHPGLPRGTVCVRVPEIDRRQNHISQVDPNHTLLPVALDCLKDKDSKRPSAHQLCQRVADLKEMPKYIDSARCVMDKDEVIRSLTFHMEEKDRTISSKEEENQQLRQQLQERDQFNNGQLEEKERQLGCVNQQLEASKRVVAQFERQIAELEQQLCQQKSKASSRGPGLTSFKLRWREGKRAPCGMSIWCDAAVDCDMVYIRSGRMIYSYAVTCDSWSQLPNCIEDCAITVINGFLTTVGGGGTRSAYSNELFSLTGEGSGRRWAKEYPPMPTKRKWTSSLCTGTTLIVAGGEGEGYKVLSTVEVMNTEIRQWSSAADLLEPMYATSVTMCGDQLYMLGGTNKHRTSFRSVHSCSVSALLQSCVPSSLEATLRGTSLEDKARVWRRVANLPVTSSTCECFHGQLLAIGGYGSENPTTAVYKYNSTTNSWEIISHMTTSRYRCFTAVLPNNQLMVVGGIIDGRHIDLVEFASV